MKLIVFTIILILCGFAVFVISTNRTTHEEVPVLGINEISPGNESSENQITISLNDKKYKVRWMKVAAEKTDLYSNFEEKETAKKLYIEHSCEVLINGGFYTGEKEENFPIGLFISKSEIISGYRENSLFNGIFSINEMDTPRITDELPEDALVSAIQTGPILQANDFEHTLKLSRDKEARRMVAAVTGGNEIIFMSIHGENSSFSGPMLVDMPKIITLFEQEAGLNIADAINLDGGAASAFYADEINISEASPIGSFFCVR